MLTGLSNPCAQLDRIQPCLMAAVLDRDAQGNLIPKAGVMGVVVAGGEVWPADPIRVELPLWNRTRRWSQSEQVCPYPYRTRPFPPKRWSISC